MGLLWFCKVLLCLYWFERVYYGFTKDVVVFVNDVLRVYYGCTKGLLCHYYWSTKDTQFKYHGFIKVSYWFITDLICINYKCIYWLINQSYPKSLHSMIA